MTLAESIRTAVAFEQLDWKAGEELWGARMEHERIRPILEKLIAVAEALERTRGQWINSVNAPECLDALARLREHAIAAVGGETPRSGSGVESVEVGK